MGVAAAHKPAPDPRGPLDGCRRMSLMRRGLLTRSIRPPDRGPERQRPARRRRPAPSARPPPSPGDPQRRRRSTGQPRRQRRRRRRSCRRRGRAGRPSGTPRTGTDRPPALTDTAWTCLDLNASRAGDDAARTSSTPPPIARRRAGSTTRTRTSTRRWEEFAKQLFWDYQASARRSCSRPPGTRPGGRPGSMSCRRGRSTSRWTAGPPQLHDRRRSTSPATCCTSATSRTIDDAHGHGPLEAGAARLVAAEVLTRYATNLAAGGGIPSSRPRAPRAS